MLTDGINIFISLPTRSLDQLALQKRLDAIGKRKMPTRRREPRLND
jgi:hypothetical protein